MKKLLSVLLTFVMMFSLASVSAFAADDGKITLNNTVAGVTYKIYKLLDLESYTEGTASTGEAYSYKANPAWTDFFTNGAGKDYVRFEGEYVYWNTTEDDSTMREFSQTALAYAKSQGIGDVATKVATGTTVEFEPLGLGYYLIDSTMGTLCSLTTTNPVGVINAKNGTPTVDKQVQEDSTNQWGGENTADIGQIINFRATIDVMQGAENYVLHDNTNGVFVFNEVIAGETIGTVSEVKYIDTSEGDTETLVLGDDYTINTSCTDGCAFEVIFEDDFLATTEANDKIVVSYTAMLKRNANIAGTGNINKAWLTYGEAELKSNEDTTKTYTYSADIVKTDSSNKLIDGAEFRIYDAATAGNEIAVVAVKDTAGNVINYRRARADETGVNIVVKDGQIEVIGLDNGTYYLEEKVPPEGYNMLTARKQFIISGSCLEATFTDGVYSEGSGVHVVNKAGTMMPETGGMGTMMFVLIGTVVVLGAGVLLVTKKRMSMIED